MQNIRSKQAQAKRDNKRMERDSRRNTEQMIPLLWRIQSISSISYLHLEDFRLDMVCQPLIWILVGPKPLTKWLDCLILDQFRYLLYVMRFYICLLTRLAVCHRILCISVATHGHSTNIGKRIRSGLC